MAVMLADVGSVLATLGFAALLFVVVIAVCVCLLALMAAILPKPRPEIDVVGALAEPVDGAADTATQDGDEVVAAP